MIPRVCKILVFAALVGGFFHFGGFDQHSHEFQPVQFGEGRAVVLFIAGAAIAVWGDKKIGVLDPISLRGIFIIIGVLMMIFACVLMCGLRESSV